MSTTIKNIFSDKTLTIGRDGEDVQLNSSIKFEDALFSRDDLLAALKAEGLLEDAPPTGVKYCPELLCYEVSGIRVRSESADEIRQRGLAHLAVANYIDEQDRLASRLERAVKEEAERELTRRRDAIVHRHAAGPGAHYYSDLGVHSKRIVDSIRELEDKLAEAI